jgi:hypothetical protein
LADCGKLEGMFMQLRINSVLLVTVEKLDFLLVQYNALADILVGDLDLDQNIPRSKHGSLKELW